MILPDKFYLTEQGLEKVKQEYEKVKELRKGKLGKETPSVLYSEELNAEFVSFKEELDFLDAKIEECEYILKNYEIIKAPQGEEVSLIGLGAKVKVESEGCNEDFVIVGTIEANPELGYISNESPLGKALLNRKAGDEITITSPVRAVYKIKSVSY